MNQKTTQKGIHATGDVVGRDKTTTNISPQKITTMSALIDKFKKEKDQNPKLKKLIEELEHFSVQVSNEAIVGVEEKLKAGNRESSIDFALKTKDAFSKKIIKWTFMESAQEMFVYLLSEVWTRFNNHIRHLIESDESISNINDEILQKIIEPVSDKIGENVLSLYANHINGMLYFLTGNCHIRWDK